MKCRKCKGYVRSPAEVAKRLREVVAEVRAAEAKRAILHQYLAAVDHETWHTIRADAATRVHEAHVTLTIAAEILADELDGICVSCADAAGARRKGAA